MLLKRYTAYFTLAIFYLGLASCVDNAALVDSNQAISNRTWSYIEKIRVPVHIKDKASRYNVLINLRHTGDYQYSNIFILVHTKNPQGKVSTERREFKLALPDGQWLGKGSGNLYSYQLPYKSAYSFADTGQYFFEIEQNMRDNPLKEIADVGLRVEKSK